MPGRYFNWKLAIVLVLGLVVFGAGVFSLRQWQRSDRAEQGYDLGIKAYNECEWAEAAEQLGRYLAVEQQDTDTLLKYAYAQLQIRPMKRNNVLQAIEAYRRVLRNDEGNSKAAEELADVYLMMNMPGEAELIIRRFPDTAKNFKLRRMLALSLIGQRKFIEAAAELKAICADDTGQILTYEALGQLAAQRPAEVSESAQFWFDEAIKNNPNSALAYIIRAGFHRRNHNMSMAVADLDEAEKRDLSDNSVRLRLAEELVNTNLLDRAEKHLIAIDESDSTINQQLWQVWARLAFQSQSKEKMLKVAQEGLKKLSSQPWDFMLVAAELFIRSGELELASGCISQLHQKDIAPATVLFLEGLVASNRGNISEALRCWRESMKLGNKSPAIRLAMASALSRLGDTQSAIQQLRTLIFENVDYYNGHIALAQLLIGLGNWAEAAEEAATALSLAPNSRDAALLYMQAQIQLLTESSDSREQINSNILQDLENQLSSLDNDDMINDNVKMLKFHLAMQQHDFTEAQELISQLKKSNLSQVTVGIAEVELLSAQDKTDEAVQKLNEMIKEYPESQEVITYLAVLRDQRGERLECELVLKEALERIEEPLVLRKLCLLLADFYGRWEQDEKEYELFSSMAKKLPNDIPVRRRLLRCEQVINNIEVAQKIVDEIKSLDGEEGWQWRFEQARLWFVTDNFKDRYPQIVSLLQENLLANPGDQTSRVLLARSYERAGEGQLAISTYREALNRSPDDLRVLIPAIAALYNARQYDEAEQILSRASRQDIFHPELSKLQLRSYLRHGELDMASDILEDLLINDPNNQAACLSLALLKMQQNQFEEAGKLLIELKTKAPDSIPVTAAQVQLYIRQNKTEEALRLCDDMINNLKNASAYVLRARTYTLIGQNDKAADDFGHAVSVEPNNVDVWISSSDFNRSLGRVDKAIADIDKALTISPNDIRVQKRAISLFHGSEESTRLSQARSLLEAALKSNPDDVQLRLLKARSMLAEGTVPAIENAELVLKEITNTNPEVSDAWVLLGDISLRRAQPGAAVDIAMLGLAHKPNDKSLLLLKARSEAVRSPILAVPTLKLLCELDPNDIDTATLLANTYIAIGESQKAIDLLTKRMTASDMSKKRKCMMALAVAVYKNGNKDEALNELDSLMEAEPDDPNPLLTQVQLLKDDLLWDKIKQKTIEWYRNRQDRSHITIVIARDLASVDDGQARQVAEEILKLILGNEENNAEALNILAILKEMMGNSADSMELYVRILKLEPDNLIALNNLAWLLCEKQGKYQDALKLTEKGLKIAPNYFDLIDTRGMVYFRLGEFDKAIQDFSKCIKLNPDNMPSAVATHFHLARAFAKDGQRNKALESLNRALNLNKEIGGLSDLELAEAKDLLKQLSEEGS